MNPGEKAARWLRELKGDSYAFGSGALSSTGEKAGKFGRRALVAANPSAWLVPIVTSVKESLSAAGVEVTATTTGARPNSPLEDVYRIQDAIEHSNCEVVVAVGGGSTLDAVKGAAVLAALSPGIHDVEPFFGAGMVTKRLAGRSLPPVVAIETAASSAAHLTRYSNLTNLAAGQKKLIIDDAIVPPAAVFDYSVTLSAPRDLTIDGAFDGVSHCLEVYCGAKGDLLEKVEPVALAGIGLCIAGVRKAAVAGADPAAREALGLGTDLGGWCIMTGSTNAGHLTSFSLVDVTTHGRATAVLNPYYLVLFAPALKRQITALAQIYHREGYVERDVSGLSGRDLALAVASAMQALLADLGVPTALGEFESFFPAHIDRAVKAALNPQLETKLKAMPVPLDAAMVERYLRPTLEAAAEGTLDKTPTLPV